MPSEPSTTSGPAVAPIPVKLLLAGGPGAGRTTLVGTVSEILPFATDSVFGSHYGRVTVDSRLRLQLFGLPDPRRYGFAWDHMAWGALGALVLVDPQHLDDCFAAVDYFELRSIPYVVAVNRHDSRPEGELAAVRDALAVGPEVPVVSTDTRSRGAVYETLLVLLDTVFARAAQRRSAAAAAAPGAAGAAVQVTSPVSA